MKNEENTQTAQNELDFYIELLIAQDDTLANNFSEEQIYNVLPQFLEGWRDIATQLAAKNNFQKE